MASNVKNFSFFGDGGGGGGTRTSSINIPGMSRSTEPTFQDEMCDMCPKLTYQQRVIGFAVCCVVGYFLSLLGVLLLIGGGPAAIRNFAVLYVFGNVIALCGTGFLIGPARQCKKMFHPTRRIAAVIYLSMLLIVFIAAIAGAPVIVVLLLLIIQCCAAVWYSVSYIPYGRKAIVNCCKNTVCKPCKDVVKDYNDET
ncbi:unnamed protein product [Phaeothamnion confervicola]